MARRTRRSIAILVLVVQPPATKAIAHGTAVTEPDGTFKIQFTAEPDRAVPAKNEPVFVFTIHADVTDTTGETRSDDRTVRAGYTALQASLAAGEWQTPDKPVEFTIETNSLDGDPQPADGTVTIYALRQPAEVRRSELPGHPSRGFGTFTGETPVPLDPSNPDSWELGQAVAEKAFMTDAAGKKQVAAPLKAGIYRASLETTDRFGKKVTARQTVQVVDPREPHYGVRLPNHFTSPKWSVEPGEKFHGALGHRLRHGPRVCGAGVRRQTAEELLDGARPDAGTCRTACHRGYAWRADVENLLRPREPRLLQRARRRRAVVEQAARREVGKLPFQAHARPERDVDGGDHRPRRQTRCRRDGRHTLRCVARPISSAQLAAGVQRVPA